ncbi:hypothetical protein D0T88_04605 [Escherichia coli]|nr:hypothetical protein D0T88_04605 [Escherichia coli]
MKKTAPDGAVSGMPAIRETGPGKNLQAITVSCITPQEIRHYDEMRYAPQRQSTPGLGQS